MFINVCRRSFVATVFFLFDHILFKYSPNCHSINSHHKNSSTCRMRRSDARLPSFSEPTRARNEDCHVVTEGPPLTSIYNNLFIYMIKSGPDRPVRPVTVPIRSGQLSRPRV